MANKGYYYLKLKENFFDSDELKILESLENGYLYSNILLKLYLKALKNEGKLTFNEFIPYDVKMLATITGHNVDIVDKAIKVFQNMHLIEILDNGTIYMLDMQKMIGSISSEGVRKQEYREKIRLEKENGTKLGQCPYIISNSISNSNLDTSNINTHSSNLEQKDKVTTNTKLTLNKQDKVTAKDQVGVKVITNRKEKANKEKENLQEYVLTIFEEVWKIYPRKVNKVRAKQTFLKLFKVIKTREDAKVKGGKIYGAVEKQKKIWDNENTEETFIPYFSSWLNANFE